ncbi:ribosome biogenesis GTPase Der [Pantoea sp. Nvir]|uniref:ribosome biogenesis GTPase Der n=1 Tax=Pantoea sp. Nvir TaxID=2576760 RepID=UPI00135BF724|nr:ribosome biogenesis GTPase Der [Pantoea sp. Nvir]MXP66557.1 ribosome biogenesis GTPase Der [Pantoea sp. Nvir]CAJ0992221.1 GTPase Der [Pantoea sp. Nvir]
MIPVVVLVGRPNVGKSTLFNCLTRTRDALVANSPGLTRDRKYGYAKVEGHEFIVIDTGGISNAKEESVESRTIKQSLLAIDEADVVLFILDARVGLMPEDQQIACHIRSRQKPTFLVANKTDILDSHSMITDFYSLGLGDIYSIAASHGRGITSFLETVLLPWMNKLNPHKLIKKGTKQSYRMVLEVDKNGELPEDEAEFDATILPIKLAIVGRPNVGKSTLINRILGEDRVVVYEMPGTTRDSIYIPMECDGREYIVIDTAGVRRRGKITDTIEKFSVIKTLQAIKDANVVMLVIDARQGISDQDLSLLSFILNSGRSLVIVVNKCDGLTQAIKEKVKKTLDYRLGFMNFAYIHFISALYGNGVSGLFKSANVAYDCSIKRVNTSMLTRIMHMATENYQPPIIRGRRVKMKYAHAGGYNPPVVVIHGNQVQDLPDSYKRYLINYYRRSLNLMGTPIRIFFKESDNPFADRRNLLTPTQKRKRKRFILHLKKNKRCY